MDVSNKDAFRRFTYTATMDRNAAKVDSDQRTTKGRPFLIAVDAMKADIEVNNAKQGASNYD